MTALSLSPIVGFVWLAAAWVFAAAVLLKRWRQRERMEAAHTKRVMGSLTSDTTNAHIFDGA